MKWKCVYNTESQAICFLAITATLKQMKDEGVTLSSDFEKFVKIQTAKTCSKIVSTLGLTFYSEEDETLLFCKDCCSTFMEYLAEENHYLNKQHGDKLSAYSATSHDFSSLKNVFISLLSDPKEKKAFEWFSNFALLSEEKESELLHFIKEGMNLYIALCYLPKHLPIPPRNPCAVAAGGEAEFFPLEQILFHYLKLQITSSSPTILYLFDVKKSNFSIFLNSLSPATITRLKENRSFFANYQFSTDVLSLLEQTFPNMEITPFAHWRALPYELRFARELSNFFNCNFGYLNFYQDSVEEEGEEEIFNKQKLRYLNSFITFPDEQFLQKDNTHFFERYVISELDKLIKDINFPASSMVKHCFLVIFALRLFNNALTEYIDVVEKEASLLGLYHLLKNKHLKVAIFTQTKEFVRDIIEGRCLVVENEKHNTLLSDFLNFLTCFDQKDFFKHFSQSCLKKIGKEEFQYWHKGNLL